MDTKFVCLVGLCIWYLQALAEVRRKRVIHGEEIDSHGVSGYAAISYYVWIGFGRKSIWEYIYPFARIWEHGRLMCGGALLTARVVQTACHCFCDFEAPRKDGKGRAVRNGHSFEGVAGWTRVIEVVNPIGVVKYQIHPKCAENYWRNVPSFLTHDYALITMETEFYTGKLTKPSPVYPLLEMAEMWMDLIAKEAVCLVMGFGRFLPDNKSKSPVLRHGWHALMSYQTCFYLTGQNIADNVTKYQEDATWSCMLPFGPRTTLTSHGDSGSPVTCDNLYFSIVSSGGGGGVETYQDLVYYAFANSAEYRAEMVRLMGDQHSDAHKEVDTPGRWTTGTAPPNYFVARSSGYELKVRLGILLSDFAALLVFSPN